MATPNGDLRLVADAEGRLCAAEFLDCEDRLHASLARRLGVGGYSLRPGPCPVTVPAALDR
jgi:hypothetical protein